MSKLKTFIRCFRRFSILTRQSIWWPFTWVFISSTCNFNFFLRSRIWRDLLTLRLFLRGFHYHRSLRFSNYCIRDLLVLSWTLHSCTSFYWCGLSFVDSRFLQPELLVTILLGSMSKSSWGRLDGLTGGFGFWALAVLLNWRGLLFNLIHLRLIVPTTWCFCTSTIINCLFRTFGLALLIKKYTTYTIDISCLSTRFCLWFQFKLLLWCDNCTVAWVCLRLLSNCTWLTCQLLNTTSSNIA